MADRPRDLLDDVYKKVDTAESGWMAFKASAMLKYNDAYKLHSGALSAVKETLKNDAERRWLVLNIVLAGTLAAWVPRLLAPVQGKIDKLTNAWVKDALTEINGEAQKTVQDTALGQMQKAGDSTEDPYEPVVDSTLEFGARLEHGLEQRAFMLKTALNDAIDKSDKWTMDAALSFQLSFLRNCPFVTDVPTDTSETGAFMNNFQKQSELGMWVEWALARDEKWWKARWYQHSYYSTTDYKSHYASDATDTLIKMKPVMDRLLVLGVKPHEVTFQATYRGVSSATALDMLKMITWAKHIRSMEKLRASAHQEQVCKATDSLSLKLRKREGVSYPSSTP